MLCPGHPLGSLHSTISLLAGCDLFSSIILSFALYTVLSRTAVPQHRAGALLVSIFGTTSVSPLSSD